MWAPFGHLAYELVKFVAKATMPQPAQRRSEMRNIDKFEQVFDA